MSTTSQSPVHDHGAPRSVEFVVLIVGQAPGGVARLVAGAVADALPGGWLHRVVAVRASTDPRGRRPGAAPPRGGPLGSVTGIVDGVLRARRMPIVLETPLTHGLVADADLVLTTDHDLQRRIADWPTSATTGEAEPPEVFGAYEARVLHHEEAGSAIREARSLAEFTGDAHRAEVVATLAAIERPARFVANVIRAVVTSRRTSDP